MSDLPASHVIELPFNLDGLEPHISKETLDFHYNKHHKGYETALSGLISGTKFENLSLEDIIDLNHSSNDKRIYNNAAQVWNHNFYWKSLCPPAESHRPKQGDFFQAITNKGGFDHVLTELVNAAMTQFGSGWAWLVRTSSNEIDIKKTSNADPVWLNSSDKPLLIVDVWEHAYYLDYQNRRKDHVATILNHVINWSFAEKQYNAVQ